MLLYLLPIDFKVDEIGGRGTNVDVNLFPFNSSLSSPLYVSSPLSSLDGEGSTSVSTAVGGSVVGAGGGGVSGGKVKGKTSPPPPSIGESKSEGEGEVGLASTS